MHSGRLARWIDWIMAKPLRRLVERPRTILKDYVRAGMTTLDVGCGEGFYTIGMARLVGSNGRVISVDPKAEALDALKRHAARASLSERIDTRVCADRDLAIDDLAGHVDFALAAYVVHHAPDKAGMMRNVYRALRPGGTFLIIEPRHHASPAECGATEAAAEEAGFEITGHPNLVRDWALRCAKAPSTGGQA
jgi:ubiquinone/menaquinone biosynthesis C-methylase UbiE